MSATFRLSCALIVALVPGLLNAQPQTSAGGRPSAAQTESAKDTLGRETPRGTLIGFMRTFREGNREAACQYLNTNVRGSAAIELAHEVYVVLDRRLPARFGEVSDRPEGGLANPLRPDRDIVGTISTANGPLDIVVERVTRGSAGRVWLFSRQTLDAIPEVFDEVDLVSLDRFLPRVLTKTRIGGVRLFDWVALVLVVPLLYRLIGLFDSLTGRLLRLGRRSPSTGAPPYRPLFPGFVRLLLLAAGIQWLLHDLDLPLAERRFWFVTSAMFAIVGFVWLLLRLNTAGERYLQNRFRSSGYSDVAVLLRLVRRTADALVVVMGGLITLKYFGVDPTAALAGLGIGGIAVALAAQKTLENVIGGLSIIFDKAVRVGDFLKLGDTLGTVDSIGLRSTRIRMEDRSILSVPNGQIANMNIETQSERDKFWFHHFVGLRYETTPRQMRAVLDGIRSHLTAHPLIDRGERIRVRFIGFGRCSLEVELYAYVRATNKEAFLETQQELLLDIMDLIERSGTFIALPSQTLYFPDSRSAATAASQMATVGVDPPESRRHDAGPANVLTKAR